MNSIIKENPAANIYTTGHSLGGALASVSANYYGLKCIAFNSPPDALASESLGLDTTNPNIYHYGIGTDPIFIGKCNTAHAYQFCLSNVRKRVQYSIYVHSNGLQWNRSATWAKSV